MNKRALGFTLFEVLGALVLLALLLLGIYAGMRTATHTVQAGETKISQLDEVRSAQQYLRRELSQTLAQAIAHDDSGNTIYFIGSSDEMRFVAPLPGYLGQYGPQLQRVQLVNDDNGSQRLEVSLAVLPPDGSPPRPLGDPQVLLKGIHGGRFSYRGFDQQGNVLDWQDDWKFAARMPALVDIKLTLDHGRDWPQLSIPLRVNAAATQGPGNLLQGMHAQGGQMP